MLGAWGTKPLPLPAPVPNVGPDVGAPNCGGNDGDAPNAGTDDDDDDDNPPANGAGGCANGAACGDANPWPPKPCWGGMLIWAMPVGGVAPDGARTAGAWPTTTPW